jgi:hypothetical protein
MKLLTFVEKPKFRNEFRETIAHFSFCVWTVSLTEDCLAVYKRIYFDRTEL